ncbi:NUC185 domain-containing protein [Chytridium lagenaria]|nr:NUC185 domain-containing protein [Chytridium lagenaria]
MNSKTSLSFQRETSGRNDYVRGKSSHMPFLPDTFVEGSKTLDINDLLFGDDDDFKMFDDVKDVSSSEELLVSAPDAVDFAKPQSKEIDDILPESEPLVQPLKQPVKDGFKHKEWAHVVDVNAPFPEFHEKVPDMAHKYNFELDLFQKRAVFHLENGDSVFVAAHTSAGKTVVAEYAIALAQKHMTRAIYTSPIKALSNQKFRDFKNVFEDVGILTGDVQIRPEASCLIMTTEILRSMLYRGADLIRDVEFVIFDEVHYVNDIERGVVWEEVIIMLPAHVTFILLSATVPNTKEFADWVGRTKRKDIYVISTLKRPVPLEHHLFVEKDIYKIVISKRAEAKKDARPTGRGDGGRGGRGGQRGARGSNSNAGSSRGGYSGGGGSNSFSRDLADRNTYISLIGLLKKRSLLPVIVFSFSKKKCEEYANVLVNMDLTGGAAEKSEIHVFIERSLSRLKGTDRELPQVLRIRELLGRGIAVHHGGQLPIIKEMVEILFTRGLVKVLFATETFAMGVNAPARAVVFSMIRKHDGRSFRELLPGRAGRRGLDDTGVVIIACNEDIPEQGTLSQMILGKPTKLESQFRLTYTMILNLLRVEALKVEEMIKRSFSENSAQKLLPEQQMKYDESAKKLSTIKKLECGICADSISPFYDLSARIMLLNHELRERLLRTPAGARSLVPGRVVIVNSGFYRNTLAIILQQGMVASGMGMAVGEVARADVGRGGKPFVFLLLVEKKGEAKVVFDESDLAPLPLTAITNPESSTAVAEVASLPYTDIFVVTKHTVKFDFDAITDTKNELETAKALEMLRKIAAHVASSGKRNYDFCIYYAMIHTQKQLEARVADLAFTISDQNLELLPEYQQRIEVLKEMKYIDEIGTVQLKGRVACEINTADELILTELILNNFLAEYEPAEIVALLSCFVFQEKNASQPNLSPNLQRGVDEIKTIALKVWEVQQACRVDLRTDDAFSGLKFGLVEVVYEWARGMSFKEITDLTDVLEGSIVRCIVRLDETCREVRGASKIIGDAGLHRKMEEAAELIRRDIVFAASLYF